MYLVRYAIVLAVAQNQEVRSLRISTVVDDPRSVTFVVRLTARVWCSTETTLAIAFIARLIHPLSNNV
ncbi:hypothetical protein [Fischerella sp. PCC 9605]|uniref:hypothetical protein n=1 Tax=Fischerella sp. PCC 9605 TaxID=1173024 RepID=UPI0004B3432F|nr:hypothetical protein [Fischerella sp. PCC 9605]